MPSDTDLHIGKRLFRRRRVLGLTQKCVAERIGVKFQQIQKYECGGSTIAACRVWQLAEALEVSVNYFYDGLPGAPLDDAPPAPSPTVSGPTVSGPSRAAHALSGERHILAAV